MRIAICDDNKDFCLTLENYISEYFQKYNISPEYIRIFHSGEDLLSGCDKYDLVFLDVEMVGINGINTGRELKKRNRRTIIFMITAYNDYLDEALRFEAFRYLTKPLDKERLFRNLKDAIYLYNTQNKRVLIETKEGAHSLITSNIIMFETDSKKLYVYTTLGRLTCVNNMSYWVETLKDMPFFRTHKSYLVNMEHVINFDNCKVYLTGGISAYLTVRKYTEFKRSFLLYLDSIT